jgi:hypothetical protein
MMYYESERLLVVFDVKTGFTDFFFAMLATGSPLTHFSPAAEC